MQKYLLLFLLAIILGIYNIGLIAGNILSSQISYKQISAKEYKVTIQYYRDCMEDSSSTSNYQLWWFIDSDTGYIKSGKITKPNIIRTDITDVTPKCKNDIYPCSPINTSGSGAGIEQHTVVFTLDLREAPFNSMPLGTTYCELGLAFSAGFRNATFTTFTGISPHWTRFSMDFCNLNECQSQTNSSPEFFNIPYLKVCCNQASIYSSVGLDTINFDSISYELVPAISDHTGNSVSYSSSFSYQYPLTPYCIPSNTIKCTPNNKTDPLRGFYFSEAYCFFTPTKCDEVSLVNVLISEWRKNKNQKMVKIGSVMREICFEVSDNCGYNKAPTVSGPSINNICEGDKICFDISGTDETFTPFQTIPDTVQINWNGGIPGATFTVKNPSSREKTSEFCWQTKVGEANEIAYSFTVTVSDNHCPKPLYTFRSFKVKVNAKSFGNRIYSCIDSSSLRMDFKSSHNFDLPLNIKWSLHDSMGNNPYYFSNLQTDTAYILYGNRNIVVCTVNNKNNCLSIYRDTISCINSVSIEEIRNFWNPKNPLHIGEKVLLPFLSTGDIFWYSTSGQLVYSILGVSKFTYVPDMVEGIYFMSFRTKTQVFTEKIMLE